MQGTLDKNKKMTHGSGKTVFGELKIHDFSPFFKSKIPENSPLSYVNIDPYTFQIYDGEGEVRAEAYSSPTSS